MRRPCRSVVALLLLGLAAPAPATASRVEALIEAERAFSAMSVEKGMKEAFLANLAGDAVVFAPLPVNARKTWQERTPPRGTLVWEPHFVELASAGDLGFSMGPWERRPAPGAADTAVLVGHFVSVWRRQAEGAWKVVLDAGISHPPQGEGLGTGHLERGPEHASASRPRPAAIRRARLDLMSLDRALARPAAAGGIAKEFQRMAAEDVRYLHGGEAPVRGVAAASEAMARARASTSWSPLGAGVAQSADLGFTYGIVESRGTDPTAPPDSSVYAHLWRKGERGKWLVVIAVENALPKPPRN